MGIIRGFFQAVTTLIMLAFALTFMAVVWGGAWACGLRFHPEAVVSYFQKDVHHPYYKFTFKSGQVMAAKIIKDESEALKVESGQSRFEIAKSDLREYARMSPEELRAEEYQDWLLDENQPQMIGYDPQGNLLKRFGLWPVPGQTFPEFLQAKMKGFQNPSPVIHVQGLKDLDEKNSVLG